MLDEAQSVNPSLEAAARLGSRRPMRIIHYYPRALVGDGGCTASVRGWAAAEAAAGADVTVVHDASGPGSLDQVTFIQLAHGGVGGLRRPIGLSPVLQDADLLVLHSGWVPHNAAAAVVAARARVPYIVTPHGAYNPNVFARRRVAKAAWWRAVESRVVRGAHAVHVFFDEEVDHVTRLGYRGPFLIAPNGVMLPRFDDRSARAGYVLWIGRFDIETKGIDLLLEALALIPPGSRPPLRLHGPEWRDGKAHARQLVRDLHLDDRVTIGPPVYGEEKWRLLRECGLFAFTPRRDSSSVMALEAAGAGAPMLATSPAFIGGRLAREGGAILVPPTAEAIAAGIVEGLDGRGEAIGRRAAEIVRDRYSWHAVAGDLLDQLERLG